MDTPSLGTRAHRTRSAGLAALAFAALAAAGCVAAPGAGSPSATAAERVAGATATIMPLPSATATGTPLAVATPTPAPVATQTPTGTPRPTPSPTHAPVATPSSPADSLPVVGRLSTSAWSTIRWLGISGPAAASSNDFANEQISFGAFGWSRGFVAFRASQSIVGAAAETIAVSTSPDGIRWHPRATLKTPRDGGFVAVRQLLEGPAGLLAVGYVEGVTCGGPQPIVALWTSTDGSSWTALDAGKAFPGGVAIQISAGAAGYAATGLVGTENAVWTSSNARTWHRVAVPERSSAKLQIGDAVPFGSGYVLSGAQIAPADGCGGPQLMTPSLWWSHDGAAWAKSTVPGVTAGTTATMSVVPVGTTGLLAVQQSYDSRSDSYSTAAWTSIDGKVWHPAPDAVARAAVNGRVASAGGRAVIVPEIGDDSGKFPVAAFDASLRLTPLRLTGAAPGAGTDSMPTGASLGPTGILVCSDFGARCWLGVPS